VFFLGIHEKTTSQQLGWIFGDLLAVFWEMLFFVEMFVGCLLLVFVGMFTPR